jgi:lysophospholipase L1-like esterase
VTDDFNAFVTAVRRDLPETRIIFVAIKPSLKRWGQFATQQQANDAIREICEASPQLTYLDVVTPMLGDNGEPKPELFADDGLHLNDAGYRLWTDLLKKHLAAK